MLNHPHLKKVDADLKTMKQVFSFVASRCDIKLESDERIKLWKTNLKNGYLFIMWKGYSTKRKSETQGRLPYILECRNHVYTLYSIVNIEPYLFKLRLLDEPFYNTDYLENISLDRTLKWQAEWEKENPNRVFHYG